jgi:6,7-dimethyl-8-ribityllumazine synthase
MPERITPDAFDLSRVAVVVSTYNAWITKGLLSGAEAEYATRGGDPARLTVVQAPGAYELTALCSGLARSGQYDAVVALGCVIRGETAHFDYICSAVSTGLTQIELETGVAIGFGLLTCDTKAQAEARSGGEMGNKGNEAMAAALETAGTLHAIRRRAGQDTMTQPISETSNPGTSDASPRRVTSLVGEPETAPPASAPVPPAVAKASPRQIRKLALIALYQLDARGEEDAAVVSENMPFAILSLLKRDEEDFPQEKGAADPDVEFCDAHGFGEEDLRAAYELACAAYADRATADEAMLELAADWPPDRQPTVDRCILRLAHHEMASGKTPPKAVINEAVELAKRYSTDRSALFVNGVLDKLMRRFAS